MSSISHPVEAKKVMHRFYRSERIVYVEGDDDILFWEYLFDKFSDIDVHVKPVGGKDNLVEHIKDILSGDILDIVAKDMDYGFMEDSEGHNGILNTYGYSIENTLVHDKSLREVVGALGKISKRDVSEEECREWVKEFEESVKPLVIYDVHNEVIGQGELVAGDNCTRFISGKNKVVACSNMVEACINDLGFTLNEMEVENYARKINEIDRTVKDVMRGHFLFSGALRFVSQTIKDKRSKISLSNDSFMGALVIAFKHIFDERHPEFHYYKSSIEAVSARN